MKPLMSAAAAIALVKGIQHQPIQQQPEAVQRLMRGEITPEQRGYLNRIDKRRKANKLARKARRIERLNRKH